MTIGPAPIRRIFWMSVRRGIGAKGLPSSPAASRKAPPGPRALFRLNGAAAYSTHLVVMLVNRAELVGILLCAALGGLIGCAGQEPAAATPMPAFATPEPRVGRASTRKTRTRLARMLTDARKARDVVRVMCLNDKLTQVDAALQTMRAQQDQKDRPTLRVLQQRIGQLGAEADQCVGQELAFVGESKVTTMVDPSMPSDADVG